MEESKNTTTQKSSDLIENILHLNDDEFMRERQQEIEIDRLTKATGKPFIIKIKSLSVDRIFELQSNSYNSKGSLHLGKLYKGAVAACCEAIIEPNFDDVRLKKKLNLNDSALKKDVLQKILKPKEIQFINNRIVDLSGFDSDIADELKNE